MLKVIIPLGIVGAGLMIYSLIESIQTPRHRVRVLPKGVWLLVILLVPIVGAGLWLAFGRVRSAGSTDTARKGPSAPDDDPEFLRQVEIQRRQKQRAEELRRKERELEDRESSAGGSDAEKNRKKPEEGDQPGSKPPKGPNSNGSGKNAAPEQGVRREGDSEE